MAKDEKDALNYEVQRGNSVPGMMKKSEKQRIKRHCITAMDAINQAYCRTKNKELKRLLEIAAKEVNKI